MLFENILDGIYEVFVNVLFKLRSNSCGRNTNFYDDVWLTILIQFEVLSQPFTFYLKVINMLNVVIHSHKLLAIFLLGCFFLIA